MGNDKGRPGQSGLAAGYTPLVSQEHAKRIRCWHDNAYAAGKAQGGATQTFSYLGTTLVVPPDVMPIVGMSHLLGEAVLAEAHEADRVLDMGTGSGVNAILAASKGAKVLAVDDINPHAVEAVRANAERNGVSIEVRRSDVFDELGGRFDLIVFDPPFRWFTPRDQFEVAITDENYGALTRFFYQARRHLAEDGRMLIFFGTSGDLAYLRRLIDKAAFTVEIVAQTELAKDVSVIR